MSKRATYLLIALICLIPVIVLGTTGIPVLTNVEPDGDVTLADGKHLSTNQVRARDAGGLGLYEDGGTAGILIDDAGAVTLTELEDGLVTSASGALSAVTAKADLEGALSDVSDFAQADGDTYSGTHDFTGATVTGIDHGALSGLEDDDHSQYLRADGTRALAGAWDMGNQALTNVNIIQDPYPDMDDTGNGEKAIMAIDSGAAITIGDCLHMDTDGEFVEADADAMATMPCQAMALEAGTGSRIVLLKGFMRNDDWDWTPGDVLYVSTTTGELTATAPSSSGNVVQVVGWAVTADVIRFAPELDRIEVQ